jgi:hypothetical protein
VLTCGGTPEKPIIIKVAGAGEAIFDGNGCFRLFDVMAADDNYFEDEFDCLAPLRFADRTLLA